MDLQKRLDELIVENSELRALNSVLQERIEKLKAQLRSHSQNSSKPPSSDTLTQRAAQNARRAQWNNKPKRRPGKQPGSPGHHLAQVLNPDLIIDHPPKCCPQCGESLEQAEVVGRSRRQVFDIPDPKVVVTEHVVERRRCSCGVVVAGSFPAQVDCPAGWGPRVQALATYLMVRQHLPVKRTCELLGDVLGARVSTGWLAGLPSRAAGGLEQFLSELKHKLSTEPVLRRRDRGENLRQPAVDPRRLYPLTHIAALPSPAGSGSPPIRSGCCPGSAGWRSTTAGSPTGTTTTVPTPCAAPIS